MVGERLLLACRLGVDVDEDRVDDLAQRRCFERTVGDREGIVERVHVQPAHEVDDEDAGAAPGLDHGGAAAGRAGREVRRAHEPRLALDEDERLALIPGMIAERHGVGAGHQDLVADRLGDAEAAGGVLAVDDDAIEPPALAQRRQPRRDGAAPGPSDDIAEEEEAHSRVNQLPQASYTEKILGQFR